MNLELIRSWDKLVSISDQWNDILSRSEADTIFLRWEWISVWKDTCTDEVKPFVIVVRDSSNQIVGLVPFYKVEYKLCNIMRYTVLRILADSASGSEYPAWIILKEHDSDDIYDFITKKLESHADEWDCIWMPGVQLRGDQKKGISRSVMQKYYINSRENNSSSINLLNCKEDYILSLSRNMRSQLRRDLKKVQAHGEICVKKCMDEQEIDMYLNALFELHDIRWKIKGLKGVFERMPKEMDFYHSFIPLALRKGWLRLYALFQGGAIKAVQLGYVYCNTYSQLQEGFDPSSSSGVGNILRLHVFEECIREGVAEYDFLGEHTEHKRRWGAKERTGYDLFIGRKSFKNLILFTKHVWPTGRYFKALN